MRSSLQFTLSLLLVTGLFLMGCASTGSQTESSESGTVTSEDYERSPASSNIFQMIEGRVAGVYVDGNSIQIRGTSSINANTNPLIVVDGTPVDFSMLNTINPRDVDKIRVLKEPSETSMYGSRGANGVLEITTKRPGNN